MLQGKEQKYFYESDNNLKLNIHRIGCAAHILHSALQTSIPIYFTY